MVNEDSLKAGLVKLDKGLSYRVIGLIYEVHNKLGHLLQEKYYQRALATLLGINNIPFEREKQVKITINNVLIGYYKLDFVVDSQLILELKVTDIHLQKYHNQVLNYMNQLQITQALLINFRSPSVQLKRLILPEKYWKI